ncbi:MAG: folate-binding protein [Alphaproteobacteria bacterium]|nr:folate-binding protein [Alphaproteobacteria bacterium]
MNAPFAAQLKHRHVIRIGGTDRVGFLQGLVSNDVAKVTATEAVYAALLTPQGKFLHDMLILADGDSFLIDCERPEDLLKRFAAYKLRARVTLENMSDAYDVWAIWRGDARTPLSFNDPRLPDLGQRAFLPKGMAPANTDIITAEDYDQHRIAFGVADGSRDLDVEKSTLAEGNFDFLYGIDWKKGCYVGQELTARMHYRGLAKKRLFPVHVEGMPAPGTPLFFKNAESGEMRSHAVDRGLALLSLDAAQQSIEENTPFTCATGQIRPAKPHWMTQKG